MRQIALGVVSWLTFTPTDVCKVVVMLPTPAGQGDQRRHLFNAGYRMKETAIMEQARATFFNTYLNWVKPSLLALLVGVVTTIFTLVGAASNAVPVILKTFNLPACVFYADVYPGTQSDFKKEGDVWREYAPDAVTYNYEFREVERTPEEIILRNLTPRPGVADSATLVVHIPACGGIVRLTEGLPERSTNLEQVWRGP